MMHAPDCNNLRNYGINRPCGCVIPAGVWDAAHAQQNLSADSARQAGWMVGTGLIAGTTVAARLALNVSWSNAALGSLAAWGALALVRSQRRRAVARPNLSADQTAGLVSQGMGLASNIVGLFGNRPQPAQTSGPDPAMLAMMQQQEQAAAQTRTLMLVGGGLGLLALTGVGIAVVVAMRKAA